MATWNCTKLTRYVLLAQNHYGVDIQGCHYSIVISHVDPGAKGATMHNGLHPTLQGANTAREWLVAALKRQDGLYSGHVGQEQEYVTMAKKILKIVINERREKVNSVVSYYIKRQIRDHELAMFLQRFTQDWLPTATKKMAERGIPWVAHIECAKPWKLLS